MTTYDQFLLTSWQGDVPCPECGRTMREHDDGECPPIALIVATLTEALAHYDDAKRFGWTDRLVDMEMLVGKALDTADRLQSARQ